MKNVFIILCISCAIKMGMAFSADTEKVNQRQRAEDLEGSETSAKLFNLGSLFPSYSSYPSNRPNNGYYPSTGGYYPTYNPTQGYYPTNGYYPTGTNVLGTGYGTYPSQSYYPSYVRTGGYGGSSGYGGYNGYGGYGGYGGNGGLKSYYGYDNSLYSGKRNLGYGYYADTDRYGFYQSPSQQYSVNRGYD